MRLSSLLFIAGSTAVCTAYLTKPPLEGFRAFLANYLKKCESLRTRRGAEKSIIDSAVNFIKSAGDAVAASALAGYNPTQYIFFSRLSCDQSEPLPLRTLSGSPFLFLI